MTSFVPKNWSRKLLVVWEKDDPNKLRSMWRRAGYSDQDVKLVNVEGETMAQIREHRPSLLRSIKLLRPKRIIGMGGFALRALTNKGSTNVTKVRGRLIAIEGLKKHAQCYITYSPSSVINGGYHLGPLILQDFKRFAAKKTKAPSEGIPSGKTLGLDTEFSAAGNLLTVGVADPNKAKAYEVTEKDWKKKIAPILKKAEIISGQNLPGDIDYLVKEGLAKTAWVTGEKTLDSLILARMMDENRGKGAYNLESLFLSEFKFKSWKGVTNELFKATQDASLWPVDERVSRCRTDAFAALLLARHFSSASNNSASRFNHLVAFCLHRVGLAGAGVDLKLFHKLGGEWQREAITKADLIKREALKLGMTEFRPTNDNDIRELLYKRLGLPVTSRTETGMPSVDKLALQQFKEEQAVQHLLDFNSVDKLSSTWYGGKNGNKNSLKDLVVTISDGLGLLHFWIDSLGARTGRHSSGGAAWEGMPEARNSQNWPPKARAIIISRWTKGLIGDNDYSQLEPTLLAWEANDKDLLAYFTDGDGYLGIARELFGRKIDKEKDKKLYKTVKSIVLGVNYNMKDNLMASNLWDKANIKFSSDWKEHLVQVGKLRRKYLNRFPRIIQYQYNCKRELQRHQAVLAADGSVRHLPHEGRGSVNYWHLENQAINFPIQRLAAAVIGSALIDIEAALLKEHRISYLDWHETLLKDPIDLPCSVIINEVHDDVVVDYKPQTFKVDREIVEETMAKLPTLRKLVPTFNLKLKVGHKVAARWGVEC